MSKFCALVVSTLVLVAAGLNAQPQPPPRPAPIPSIEDRTNGMRKIDGYFPLYWDEQTGSLFVEIPRLEADFLIATGLSAGLGSNDIGLDRGQGGAEPGLGREGDEQIEAEHGRRQNERKHDQRFGHALQRKAAPRERTRDKDGEWQQQRTRPHRQLERKPESRPIHLRRLLRNREAVAFEHLTTRRPAH